MLNYSTEGNGGDLYMEHCWAKEDGWRRNAYFPLGSAASNLG